MNKVTDERATLRLVQAVMVVVDRHVEYVKSQEGSRLLWLGMFPQDLKEIRSALEPWRPNAKAEAPKRQYFVNPGWN